MGLRTVDDCAEILHVSLTISVFLQEVVHHVKVGISVFINSVKPQYYYFLVERVNERERITG